MVEIADCFEKDYMFKEIIIEKLLYLKSFILRFYNF